MKRSVFLLVTCTFIMAGCASDQSAEIERLKAEIETLKANSVQPLPASLKSFFPPEADAPLWRIQMHAMVTPLMATLLNVQSGDMEKAAHYLDEFGKQYLGTSKMVPEWTSRFDTAAVSALQAAAASGDPEATMAAFEPVAATCHGCHLDNMVRVQQLYEWPKFSDVRVDAGERGELTLPEIMQGVEAPMIGIGLALQEGSAEQAKANFAAFKESFSLLEEACENCHETERTYFVDETVDNLIDRLGSAVNKSTPDAAAAGVLLQQIGEEACFRCHLVHVPAAFAQNKAAMAEGMGTH